MTKTISRRDFLKLGAASVGALAVGQMLPPMVAKAAKESGLINAAGDGIISTMCEMCVWRCGVLAKIEDGRVVKLDGNPEHPHSRGNLCPRGQSGLMNTYDPDRVLTPLIRVGKRGEGKFRQASWEEALDLVASKMTEIKNKYGAEAMVFSSTHNLSQPLFENLLYAFGSPNYGTQRSLCFNAMIVANLMTYGMEEPARIYDDKLKYILLTGRNLLEAISTSETHDLIMAIDRGAKVVYLDPRYTKTASKATEWLPIKPGNDLAFHLALLNVIIGEKLYNRSFVEKNTIGFDELKKEVSRYTPEWAAPLTGIPAETITRIAHEFADAAPHALAHNGWRTSNFVNSFHTQRAITILNALVGNWDVVLTECRRRGKRRIGRATTTCLPAHLCACVWTVCRGNILLCRSRSVYFRKCATTSSAAIRIRRMAGSSRARTRSCPCLTAERHSKPLSKLDFIVTVDIILNDTAWFSDVVLPEASYLERYDPLVPIGDKVFIRQPVIEPQGEAKSALWIYKQLGERLGLGDFFQYNDEEDYSASNLAPLASALEEIKAKGYVELKETPHAGEAAELTWNTPSGKIELYSDTLAKVGFSWRSHLGRTTTTCRRSVLSVDRQSSTIHTVWNTEQSTASQIFRRTALVDERSKPPPNLVSLTDDWVEVTSEVGQIHTRLLVTQAIRPDCVYMTPGYGHLSKGLTTAYGVGASDSAVHVTYTDPISGGQALSQTFVTVKKA